MGRTKSYNEDVVLEKAMFSFWKHGYEQLSIRQLEKDMGINQFSIYASFQSKENLFKLVLENYKKFIELNYLADMNCEGAVLSDIRKFLLNFSHSIQTGKVPNGCLMVNTSSEITDENSASYFVLKSYFNSIREVFIKILRQEKRKGKLKSGLNVKRTALYLLGIAQSISIMSKIQTKKEIETYVNFAMSKVK